MEMLKGGIYISSKDIQVLNGGSLRQAQRECRAILDALQLQSNKLTVKAYCKYLDLDYDEVVRHINQYR